MGEREMGGYWSSEERRKISTLWQKKGEQEGSIRKCVPLAKATRMTKSQKASAVRRKRAAGNPGGKPTNVKTFAASGGYISKERRAGAAVRGFNFKGVF